MSAKAKYNDLSLSKEREGEREREREKEIFVHLVTEVQSSHLLHMPSKYYNSATVYGSTHVIHLVTECQSLWVQYQDFTNTVNYVY